jgi:hypothetical protein
MWHVLLAANEARSVDDGEKGINQIAPQARRTIAYAVENDLPRTSVFCPSKVLIERKREGMKATILKDLDTKGVVVCLAPQKYGLSITIFVSHL